MDETFINERLFRPFDSTKGKAGMGIGVYEARDYIHKMGGDIEVISRAGEGSTFRIRLPISEVRVNYRKVGINYDTISITMDVITRKLLVIEDDPGLQTQLRWCFENFDVFIAGERETALNAMLQHQPPVITLDLGLPPDAEGTSEGFALLGDILLKAPHAKIIVVTGNNDREHATRSVAMGAYDFFYKPIDADMLELIVNRAYRVYRTRGGKSPPEYTACGIAAGGGDHRQ